MKRGARRSPTTVAVFGFGSIGRRHAANAARLGARVVISARSPGKVAGACRQFGYRNAASPEEAFALADAVIIATPTDAHMPLALRAARLRKPMFLEKPLAESRRGVSALSRAARGLAVEVGCQLRAHPALRLLHRRLATGADGAVLTFRGCVGQRLDQWRPGTNYRDSYSADARRGGGALLDLIHEIDLAIWLCGSMRRVVARLSQVSDLQMRADDLANLLLESRGGACGSLQLDMLSPVYRRSFEVVCARARYEWDYASGVLRRFSPRGVQELWRAPAGFERNDLFVEHLRHFLRRVRRPSLEAMCSLADGIAALDLALAARESSRLNRWRTLGRSH
jgi:predicted dehydrogenase